MVEVVTCVPLVECRSGLVASSVGLAAGPVSAGTVRSGYIDAPPVPTGAAANAWSWIPSLRVELRL